ncbi:MAG: T9SS type A sorting domain-containing protein [Ignavibacteria bacterium]|nr:T9SS type A sorting domain-containing protein [Ignavibacteria bacterium]
MNRIIITLAFALLTCSIQPQNKVYIVLGSDTALWDGMSTNSYVCHYNLTAIPDATGHYFAAMQNSYRNSFSDSYGGKVKFTWWLMGGNIYRYADNKNVPHANTMVPWVAKKAYGMQFNSLGDELSLHYHSFVWTDYNKDGQYFWNQAQSFSEYKDDFDYTLAQYLIEENIFPVSFRAGWNYMDNDWQNYLDKWIPFSMHNQYLEIHKDTVEPIDNNYDWSHSVSEYVPYHPSATDYQVRGNLKGYELRSNYVTAISQSVMNSIFARAGAGTDQILCVWAHVWDDPFLPGMQKLDSLAHNAATAYPSVKFKYCTAVEAMQLWKKTTDFTPPLITISEESDAGLTSLIIQTNKAIFQAQPFVAMKDIYENYSRLDCVPIGANTWKTVDGFPRAFAAKAGVAVTDTSGNLATKFMNFLPDDIYLDDESNGYQEVYGAWTSAAQVCWGQSSRQAVLSATDSAAARWAFTVPSNGLYNIFIQSPKTTSPCTTIIAKVANSSGELNSRTYNGDFTFNDWQYINTVNLNAGNNYYVELKAMGAQNQGKVLTADAVKISALVKQKEIVIPATVINAGEVSKFDTIAINIPVYNHGIDSLSITSVLSQSGLTCTASGLPFPIAAMSSSVLRLRFSCPEKGQYADTVLLRSTDPGHQVIKVVVNVKVTDYFTVTDNDDTGGYKEFGTWAYSNAHAYSTTSRYAAASQSPKPYATFTASLKQSGKFDVWYIVPATQNASTNAKYSIVQNGVVKDTASFNQNTNSGNWVKIGTCDLDAISPVQVTVTEAQQAPASTVLRADAIKFSVYQDAAGLVDGKTNLPLKNGMLQNYPNPFNATTVIHYSVSQSGLPVRIKVYNLLGQETSVLVHENLSPGEYSVTWNASEYPSGIYICVFQCGNTVTSKKMLLLK